jgi:hypothetical protein
MYKCICMYANFKKNIYLFSIYVPYFSQFHRGRVKEKFTVVHNGILTFHTNLNGSLACEWVTMKENEKCPMHILCVYLAIKGPVPIRFP